MKNILCAAGLCLLQTGCGISHFHSGGIGFDGKNACVGGTYGDVLNSYSITSSEDNYSKVIASSSDPLQFPNMCFSLNTAVKEGYTYRFTYSINDQNLTDDVFMDLGYITGKAFIK